MANQFLKLRRSNVQGRIPTTSSLDFGEIAINTYDGLAFIKKSGSLGEEVISIGASSFPYTGSAGISGSLILTGSLNMTEQFANGGSTNYSSAPISIRTIGTDIPAISIYKAGFSEVNTLQFLSNDLSARWSIGQGYVGNGGVYDLIIGRYSASIWSETARFVHSNGSLTISSSEGSLILGSTTPVSSSLLTMNSTSSGFLPPCMTTTQRDAISSPAIGLQIYNTTSNTNDFYNGSSWQNVGSVPTKTTSAANLFNYYNFF